MTEPTEAVGPDRNRLHDLTKLVWDEAQVEGEDDKPVRPEAIAEAGPYSVQQITEHLLAEQEDTYVVKRDEQGIYLLAMQ
jgi:hypothetical protein